MKIVLATGIYPPQIGGPATYVRNLAVELTASGHDVTVVTYGRKTCEVVSSKWQVTVVPLGMPILRWFAYAKALRSAGEDADIMYAFSSVSCGVPLWLSGLKKPKRILRLGGDFLWERYTDGGGRKSLREWYEAGGWGVGGGKWMMKKLLLQFDHIVFSTEFQQEIYEKSYADLSKHSVIENACELTTHHSPPAYRTGRLTTHKHHAPFRLLFMGRFVGFKNLFTLIDAVREMSDCVLTLVGEGPLDDRLRDHAERSGLHHRVRFVGPVYGEEKSEIFAMHDLLILPSLTEISPNVALEAAAEGLPVLLTDEHGLSERLLSYIDVAPLKTVAQIRIAVRDAREHPLCSSESAHERTWKTVMQEHEKLFQRMGVFSPRVA